MKGVDPGVFFNNVIPSTIFVGVRRLHSGFSHAVGGFNFLVGNFGGFALHVIIIGKHFVHDR